MTQQQLAKELGLSVRAVQSWEQGWREPSGKSERALEKLIQQK
jgi:DNA-binding transcriptional regulator YiaG